MKIVILNKPYDVLSQFRKDEAHMTVSDFVDDPTLRIAGRLDMDSEGLVFLTDHVGLMAQKAEEYGSHDKTFEIPEAGIA
ncbi:NADP-dependent isocitrate dehydrogenase, partial [Acinetobacter baumannii]|uniref:NADP-dependent isocitrate dehydrogenase n=1 Tax=Acinetobacter baumannii TaxID=470 RepID=UPI00366E55CD